jgi:hypothetical protein
VLGLLASQPQNAAAVRELLRKAKLPVVSTYQAALRLQCNSDFRCKSLAQICRGQVRRATLPERSMDSRGLRFWALHGANCIQP